MKFYCETSVYNTIIDANQVEHAHDQFVDWLYRQTEDNFYMSKKVKIKIVNLKTQKKYYTKTIVHPNILNCVKGKTHNWVSVCGHRNLECTHCMLSKRTTKNGVIRFWTHVPENFEYADIRAVKQRLIETEGTVSDTRLMLYSYLCGCWSLGWCGNKYYQSDMMLMSNNNITVFVSLGDITPLTESQRDVIEQVQTEYSNWSDDKLMDYVFKSTPCSIAAKKCYPSTIFTSDMYDWIHGEMSL